MPAILSVSDVNRYIAAKLSLDPKLKGVTVRGELYDFKINYKSGHAYFTLKDGNSQLKGIMFASNVKRLAFSPQVGMSVLCSGSVEAYPEGGIYQIKTNEMIPAGIGAQFLKINALKEKLREQGVFSEERKKPLPAMPKKIAAVTSMSGAALRDIINVLSRRYSLAELTVYHAAVQGADAPKSIENALKRADRSGADVIILARGGGSFEDLMPFNSEQVTLAAADCKTPLISAVGHETDTTLVDYAADKRAPTPSAAAEICSPQIESLRSFIDAKDRQLDSAFNRFLEKQGARTQSAKDRLEAHSPYARLSFDIERISALDKRLYPAAEKIFDTAHKRVFKNAMRINAAAEKITSRELSRISQLEARLNALSPYNVLERGYAMAFKASRAVSRAAQLEENDEIELVFSDKTVRARIIALDINKEQ